MSISRRSVLLLGSVLALTSCSAPESKASVGIKKFCMLQPGYYLAELSSSNDIKVDHIWADVTYTDGKTETVIPEICEITGTAKVSQPKDLPATILSNSRFGLGIATENTIKSIKVNIDSGKNQYTLNAVSGGTGCFGNPTAITD